MKRHHLRAAAGAAAFGLLAVFTTACGSNDEETPGAKEITVKLTDAGCEPHNAKAPAGPIDFKIENDGSSEVTEMEVLDGETILGEKENLTEGLSGSFSLTLEEGEYTMRCNGGDEEDGTLLVSGELQAEIGPGVEEAIDTYRAYLEENTDELIATTRPFVAAVVAGDVAEAKRLYPAARIPYERIEPVAESFGDLDPRIDARENDVEPSEFGGFHRIEKALWEEGGAKGMAPIADRLRADVEELARKVENVDLQAVQIANGANELLGEISASKITGEEERYSRLDLVDFKANVEGSQTAFEAVEPILSKEGAAPAQEIEADFDAVYAALKPYETSDGFVSYEELTKADTRKLATVIDTLAEKLSQVPAVIVGGETTAGGSTEAAAEAG